MSSFGDPKYVNNSSNYNQRSEKVNSVEKEEKDYFNENNNKLLDLNRLTMNEALTKQNKSRLSNMDPSKNELLSMSKLKIESTNLQKQVPPVRHRGSNLILLDSLSDNLRMNIVESPKTSNLKKLEKFQTIKEIEINESNVSISNKSEEYEMSSKSSSDDDDEEKRDQVVELRQDNQPSEIKPKNERAIKLWGKVKNIVKGIFNFQKINKNLQLFGTSEEQFDENNPEAYLKKLRKIQTVAEIKDESKNKVEACFEFPVFNPDGNLMMCWNMLVFILMIYTAIIMPYRVSFIEVDEPDWVVLENIIDMIFFCDVLVTLNLGYYDKDNIYVDSRKKIFITYLKSWLIIDLIASFPQNFIFGNNSFAKSTDIFRLARLSRLYRLIRIIRFLKIAKFFRKVALVQRVQDFLSINYGISRLISFLFTTLIISHLVGCLWYILPRIYDEQKNWVTQSDLQDEEPFRLYLFSIYWSFATIFTVGFGDIHAYNAVEYLISIFWMLFGVGFYSFTIGTLSSVLVNMDTRENILKGKLAILNQFSKETKLSSTLKDKIKKILIYNSQKNVFSWLDKQEIFNELPANLKFEIAKSMRNGFLKDILFFNPRYDSFIAMIVPFLLPLNFQNKEPIYKKNDHPNASKITFNFSIFFDSR